MPAHLPAQIRRIVWLVTGAVIFLVLAGATYQGVATALERREFVRPGGLVDVGGHQLHLLCSGEGSPTVVLEAAAGSMSAAWGWVQPKLSETVRVCSYDRAGLGWSEAGETGYTPLLVPDQLHALVAGAAERPPFVVVGHELGAAFARLFAARFPDDTSALVLVNDPVTTRPIVGADGPLASAWPWLARTGILRAMGTLSARADGLPGQSAGAMRAFLNRPDHLTRAATEILRANEAVVAAGAVTLDPRLPILTITVEDRVQPALIRTEADAQRVVRVVETLVDTLRSRIPVLLP